LANSGDYSALIHLLFHAPSAVAIIGSNPGADGSGKGISGIAADVAAELGSAGKRVVVVPVATLLRMNPITVPDETSFTRGNAPHVWIWPESAGLRIEFFKPEADSGRGNWLQSLRRHFDSVILDCPRVSGTPGVTEVAAMADAAVIAVEAGRTSKQQIREEQAALQIRGARVVGCILIERS
jgi:hypothetical protein